MEQEGNYDGEEGQKRVDHWTDLMGSDLQMKVTARDESDTPPQPCDIGDALYVEFIGRKGEHRDHEGGEVFQQVDNWLVVLGDKDVPPALEMGLRFMYSGESAVIFANSKYVYGPLERVHGDYVLPPNSDVVYNVRIKSLIKDENVLRDPEFQLKIALSKKQIGNDCYQYEWSDGHGKSNALLHYKKGADLMMNMLSEVDDDTDLKDRVLQVLVDCLNNVSAVYLRAKEYGKAKEAATQVIVRDPNNFKALIRAARAAIYDPAGSFEESEAAIAAAEEVDAEDQDLQKLKAELKRKHREYKRKSREMGKKMISGSTKGSKDHAKQIEPESSSDIAIDKERPFDSTNDKNQNLRPLSVDTTRHLWTKVLPYLIQILTPILTFYILNFLWKKPENQNS